MSIRHPRKSALLPGLGLALLLTATPAAASTEQPAQPAPAEENAGEPSVAESAQPGQATPSPALQSETAQSAQQQAPEKQLVLIGGEEGNPVQPGGEVSTGLFVQNRGAQVESYVLTVTLPPEQTLISLDGMSAQCDGTVCRGSVAPGPDATINLALRTRLSSSFQGTTTTIRSELQQDANPDPGQRTKTLVTPVQQSASGGAAPAPSGTGGTHTSGTGTAGNTATATGTLPRTGERTTLTALLAMGMLLLGAVAQVAGSRRPAPQGG